MKCLNCNSEAEKSFTTDVTDLGSCLIIIRNVPCYKCEKCNEVFYSGDVIKKIENIVDAAKKLSQEISVIDYAKAA